MAPEQVENEPVDGRADVYALGCVLFHCLTGGVPFRRDSKIALLWAHLEAESPRASERDPALPAAIDAVIARAMAKEPAERFASCGELMAAARSALPVGEEPRAPTLAAAPGTRRRWLALAALAVALLVAAAAILAVLLTGGGDETAPAPAPATADAAAIDDTSVITTVAGTGESGSSGDGGLATDAQFTIVGGIALDADGNIYVGDASRVRKIDTNGVISTVAGTGRPGFSGDGGPALEAELRNNFLGETGGEIALDRAGNLYVADQFNHRVRKIHTSGIITTVAGTGSAATSGDGGPATEASSFEPRAVAVDQDGNIFFAESAAVRQIDANGVITTVAGTGMVDFSGAFASTTGPAVTRVPGPATEAQLVLPQGVALDGEGNLYIVDSVNSRVRKVDTTGFISTVVGSGRQGGAGDGGPATLAELMTPYAVEVDDDGNIYVAGRDNRVRKVTP